MCFDGLIVCVVIKGLVSGTLGMLAKKCPPDAPPLNPGAAYREFQDMKFGAAGFGKCIHIGVDETGLHLFPAMILRWAGARPVVVPWTMIELSESEKKRGLIPCTLAGQKARVPAWCFDQAFQDLPIQSPP